MARFLPELDLDRWQVGNIDSDTPRSEWDEEIGPDEALFWVTRFEGDDVGEHPDDEWFETWNATQPCLLSMVRED